MDSNIRINKYLSDMGVCSRREADALINEGRITIDGRAAVMGERISGDETICIDEMEIVKNEEKVLIALNKPRGIVSTTKNDENNIVDFVNYPVRVYPVGRLDKESEGLIFLTNDGGIVNKMLRSVNGHEKEYIVKVNMPITSEFIRRMSNGVVILDVLTRRCEVEKLDYYTFRIVLTQGLNRQIRRMCEALGYYVEELKRVRICNIELGDLPVGEYREIKGAELEELYKMIKYEAK